MYSFVKSFGNKYEVQPLWSQHLTVVNESSSDNTGRAYLNNHSGRNSSMHFKNLKNIFCVFLLLCLNLIFKSRDQNKD